MRSTMPLVASLLALAVPSRGAEPLRILAAASLTDVLREAAAEFARIERCAEPQTSFAGTQTLRTQIEQGAEADVFAAADRVHSDALLASGLLSKTTVFARNTLVVITPASGSRVARLEDLARPGVALVVAAPTVPAGRYTQEAIAKLQASGAFGRDFGARLTANVVSQEASVRQVLSKVVLGAADAGFVYQTDAAAARGKARSLALPETCSVVAEYTIGTLARSHDPRGAQAFVDFVLGPAGRQLLQKHGFR